jgi:hypothetical protein
MHGHADATQGPPPPWQCSHGNLKTYSLQQSPYVLRYGFLDRHINTFITSEIFRAKLALVSYPQAPPPPPLPFLSSCLSLNISRSLFSPYSQPKRQPCLPMTVWQCTYVPRSSPKQRATDCVCGPFQKKSARFCRCPNTKTHE